MIVIVTASPTTTIHFYFHFPQLSASGESRGRYSSLSFSFFQLSSLRCSSPPSFLHFITLQSSRRAPARRLWCPNEVSSLRKLRRQLDSPLPSSRSHVYQSCIIRQARRKITLFNSHSRESLSSDSFLFRDRIVATDLSFFLFLPALRTYSHSQAIARQRWWKDDEREGREWGEDRDIVHRLLYNCVVCSGREGHY